MEPYFKNAFGDTAKIVVKLTRYAVFTVICFTGFTHSVWAAKKAFVFGISNYENVRQLKSPEYDANVIKDKLVALEFNVTRVDSARLTKADLISEWAEFLNGVNPNDDVIIYYSGHGVEVNGTNYVVPVDAPKPSSIHSQAALSDALISLSGMMDDLSSKGVNVSIWVLDACRDNPFPSLATKSVGQSNGMNSDLRGNGGSFVFYAAARDQSALDRLPSDPREDDINSVFTRVLAELMLKESTKWTVDLAEDVKFEVLRISDRSQRPAYYNDLEVRWCFKTCEKLVDSDLIGFVGGVNMKAEKGSLAAASNAAFGSGKGFENKSRGGADAARSLAIGISQATGTQSGESLSDSDRGKLSNAIKEGVVFVGRESSLRDCKEVEVSDRYPFGCATLRAAAGSDFNSLIGHEKTALTRVNVRKGFPILSDTDLHMSCVIGHLNKGDSVSFTNIFARIDSFGITDSNEDKTYYATFESAPRECADKADYNIPISKTTTQENTTQNKITNTAQHDVNAPTNVFQGDVNQTIESGCGIIGSSGVTCQK